MELYSENIKSTQKDKMMVGINGIGKMDKLELNVHIKMV
jgi:hypothetical protein